MGVPASTDLSEVVISNDVAFAIFSDPDSAGIDEVLADLRERINVWQEEKRDIADPAHRNEIRSFAHRITKSKSTLEKVGKTVADRVKLLPKQVDANRRKLKETIEQWHDEVRKPLTDWETSEKSRIDAHTAAIDSIRALSVVDEISADELRERIATVEAISTGPETQEFHPLYDGAKLSTLETLRVALVRRVAYEAEMAELTKLRAEAEERKKNEQIEAMRLEAEERARLKVEADTKAEQDRIKREDEERSRNLMRRAEVNRMAVQALISEGVDEAVATRVISLIAAGAVPNVKISY